MQRSSGMINSRQLHWAPERGSTKPCIKTREQKAGTAPQTAEVNHGQEIRHPAAILKLTSPIVVQYLIKSQHQISTSEREMLLDQIVILSAVRSNKTPDEAMPLLPTEDAKYMLE